MCTLFAKFVLGTTFADFVRSDINTNDHSTTDATPTTPTTGAPHTLEIYIFWHLIDLRRVGRHQPLPLPNSLGSILFRVGLGWGAIKTFRGLEIELNGAKPNGAEQ